MICEKCNAENKEGVSRCKYCGSPIRPDPGEERRKGVLACISGQVKGMLFFPALLMFTLGVVMQLHRAFAGGQESALGELVWLENSMDELLAVTSVIPSLVTVIGLWLLLVSGLRCKDEFSTMGLKAMVTGEILSAVSLGLTCMIVFGFTQYVSERIRGAAGFVWIIAIGVLGFAGLMIAMNIIAINRIRRTIEDGIPNSHIPAFVGVMCIIGGVAVLIGLIGDFNFGDLLAGLARIVFGIQFFAYKGEMAGLESRYLC